MSNDSVEKSIKIELIYPLPHEQTLISISIPDGTNVEKAISISGILEQYPEIDLSKLKVGIFSKVVKLNETLRDGDRIEIYRPLIADPKEIRRKKALQKKSQTKS